MADIIMNFPTGTWADQAAEQMFQETQNLVPGAGYKVKGVFNDVPMIGHSRDHCADVILMRWQHAQTLTQLRDGVLTTRDIDRYLDD